MSKTTKSYGDPVAVVMTRPRKCADKADGTNCGNKTRMAIVVPTSDQGLSCVSLCGACIQDAFVSIVKEGLVAYEYVDEVVIEAIMRLAVVKAAKDPDG